MDSTQQADQSPSVPAPWAVGCPASNLVVPLASARSQSWSPCISACLCVLRESQANSAGHVNMREETLADALCGTDVAWLHLNVTKSGTLKGYNVFDARKRATTCDCKLVVLRKNLNLCSIGEKRTLEMRRLNCSRLGPIS